MAGAGGVVCVKPSQLQRYQRAALSVLCFIGAIYFGWLAFPIFSKLGGLLLLNRSLAGRLVPALGLANVAIVCLCMTGAAMPAWFSKRTTALLSLGLLMIGFFVMLRWADRHMDYFLSIRMVLEASFIAALMVTLMLSGRQRLLALLLVGSHALSFGAVNPVQRGLRVFLDSDLYRFMHQDPAYRRDRWIIYSEAMVKSGFFAAVGCEIMTGTHYLPDIDHFDLYRARGLDLDLLNRLAFLNASPVGKPAGEGVEAEAFDDCRVVRASR